jgi:hypothetical protein
MTFKNEYIPKLEDEASEFLRNARKKLNVGQSAYDKWTVDRTSNAVLVRVGAGRDEAATDDYWRFLNQKDAYAFTTTLLESEEVSASCIYIKRSIGFREISGLDDIPDAATSASIKDALAEYKDLSAVSKYESCDLVLVDAQGRVL